MVQPAAFVYGLWNALGICPATLGLVSIHLKFCACNTSEQCIQWLLVYSAASSDTELRKVWKWNERKKELSKWTSCLENEMEPLTGHQGSCIWSGYSILSTHKVCTLCFDVFGPWPLPTPLIFISVHFLSFMRLQQSLTLPFYLLHPARIFSHSCRKTHLGHVYTTLLCSLSLFVSEWPVQKNYFNVCVQTRGKFGA